MPDTHPPRPALAARYPAADTPAAAFAEHPLVQSLLNHRTVRAYTEQPIPAGMLETLVAAAQSAPTSSNLQAWSLVAVQDRARIARLADLSNNQGFINGAPLFLVWVADLSRNQRLGRAAGRELAAVDYLESYMVAIIDAALAAQNLVVAAEALGLGTCYIGGLRSLPERISAELDLPPNAMGLFGMAIGWPDAAKLSDIKPRLPQSAVLHHETYKVTAEEGAAAERYDAAMLDFSRRVGQAPAPWLSRMFSRLADAGALSGRHRMVEALKALGFGLK